MPALGSGSLDLTRHSSAGLVPAAAALARHSLEHAQQAAQLRCGLLRSWRALALVHKPKAASQLRVWLACAALLLPRQAAAGLHTASPSTQPPPLREQRPRRADAGRPAAPGRPP